MFIIEIYTSHGSPGVNFLRSVDSGGSRTRFSENGIFVGGKKLNKTIKLIILIFIYLFTLDHIWHQYRLDPHRTHKPKDIIILILIKKNSSRIIYFVVGSIWMSYFNTEIVHLYLLERILFCQIERLNEVTTREFC